MIESLIGLLGALVGGAIGIITQIVNSSFEDKRWKKEKTIEVLRIKKEKLEEKYHKCTEDLYNSLKTNRYEDSVFDVLVESFPKNVCDAYKNVIDNTTGEIEERRHLIGRFIMQTKDHLNIIEKQIMDEINK